MLNCDVHEIIFGIVDDLDWHAEQFFLGEMNLALFQDTLGPSSYLLLVLHK